MAPAELKGILVALITPFSPDDSQSAIDKAALDAHIQRLIAAGVHGLVPGGSTGEFPTLTPDERKLLVEQTVRSAAGRVPVIAGIGDLSTSRAVEHARHAAAVGASALMVVPPFYDAPNLSQLRDFLREIHKATISSPSSSSSSSSADHPGRLPIVYYNIPSASGVSLSPAEMAGLSDVGVTHVKDTSGNAPAFTEMLFSAAAAAGSTNSNGVTSRAVTAFNGWDTLTFYGLAAGAKGSVWGATNVIPELSSELWKTMAEEADLRKGRELWSKIFPICKFLESHNYASAVKTGMELRGWRTGGLRKPFELLEGEARMELAGLLRDAGVDVVGS